MASAGLLPFRPGQISEFMGRMGQRGFPAVHHSQVYEALYRPAYRVVSRAFLEPGISA